MVRRFPLVRASYHFKVPLVEVALTVAVVKPQRVAGVTELTVGTAIAVASTAVLALSHVVVA